LGGKKARLQGLDDPLEGIRKGIEASKNRGSELFYLQRATTIAGERDITLTRAEEKTPQQNSESNTPIRACRRNDATVGGLHPTRGQLRGKVEGREVLRPGREKKSFFREGATHQGRSARSMVQDSRKGLGKKPFRTL